MENVCKYWKCYSHGKHECENRHTPRECGDCHECSSCKHYDEAYPENNGYCWRYEE